MFRQRVGAICQERGLSYTKFARNAGIGFRTAKELYYNPNAQMNTVTLYKCSKFFGVPITDLLVESDEAVA